jgi:hypothetical protein
MWYEVRWTVIVEESSPSYAVETAWGIMEDALRSVPEGATIFSVRDSDTVYIGSYAMQEDGKALRVDKGNK